MTVNEYQQAALRTINSSLTSSERLLDGVMGLCGESGECIDLLKKTLFQGHELDGWHLVKELGDVAWYLAISADALGVDLETVFQANIDKLKARYPKGFETGRSVNRESGDV